MMHFVQFWHVAHQLQSYLPVNMVPDVLKAIGLGGIVVQSDAFSEFHLQRAPQVLAEHKRKRRKQELHNKHEDDKAEVLK